MSTSPPSTEIFVGIDVSKTRLDLYNSLNEESWSSTNNPAGVAEVVARLYLLRPTLIVFESTGGLEMNLLAELLKVQLPAARVHPGRAREFARSKGLLAKTDRIDARMLAQFAQAIRPQVTQLPSEKHQQLNALSCRRRQVVDIIVAEQNHLDSAHLSVRKLIEDHLDYLQTELTELERQIAELIEQTAEFFELERILRSAKGVGPILSAKLISALPELGKLNGKQIAALVGVAPYNDDSGFRRKRRRIKGGRADIRQVLYMATISAIRSNPSIKPFYQRLREKGKETKVAIVACMRKLLVMLNAMVRDRCPFKEPVSAAA
jgi:transposase